MGEREKINNDEPIRLAAVKYKYKYPAVFLAAVNKHTVQLYN